MSLGFREKDEEGDIASEAFQLESVGADCGGEVTDVMACSGETGVDGDDGDVEHLRGSAVVNEGTAAWGARDKTDRSG
jgi:hypothetical protein